MNLLRRTLRPNALQRFAARSAPPLQRRFGGDMPTPQSMKAELWQGHPKHPEGWEFDLYLSYGLVTILMVLALGFAPDTSIQAWAQGEAQARLDLKAKGFDNFEFGKHYNTTESNEKEWEKFNAKVRKD
jgi:hypothetical protein